LPCWGNKLLDHVPGLNKIHADPESLQKKIGFFGEPMFIGIVIGALMGIFAGYSFTKILLLAMTMAACMLIMPKMVALLMEGLSTIASGAQTFARSSKIFKGRDILIGIDGAIVMSYPGCIAVGTLMIPLSLVIAPDPARQPCSSLRRHGGVSPSGSPGTPSPPRANIVRGLILSCIMCVCTLLIATNLAPLTTAMAQAVGYSFPEGATQITSMSVGQHLASWVIVKVFSLFA
jgi:PTS system galactitol-specific IIC component